MKRLTAFLLLVVLIAPRVAVPQALNASFVGSISGTALSVTRVISGTIQPGQILSGTNVLPGTTITSQTSGTAGGAGNYVVSVYQSVGSTTITATGTTTLGNAIGGAATPPSPLVSGSKIAIAQPNVSGAGYQLRGLNSTQAAGLFGGLNADGSNPTSATTQNLGLMVTAKSLGMAGDAVVTAGISVAANSTNFTGLTGLTNADIGKTVIIPGIGTGGAPFTTTLASTTTLAAAPPYSTGGYYAGPRQDCPVVSAGGSIGNSYVPNDTSTVAGGIASTPTTCVVMYTTVTDVALVAGGTGGTPGSCSFVGTTGTGNRVLITGTIGGGGALSGPLTIGWGGAYTVNPTVLTAEPIAGCSLSGATVSIGMGVYVARKANDGSYAVSPVAGGGAGTGTVTQASSTGAGTGVTFSLTYAATGAVIYGTDNLPGLSAMGALTGKHLVYVPSGTYLVSGCAEIDFAGQTSILGDSDGATNILLTPECVFPSQGWLKWADKPRVRLSHLTFDLNYARRNVISPITNPIYLLRTEADVDYVSHLNGGPWQTTIGFASSTGTTLVHPTFRHLYSTQTTSLAQLQCFAMASVGGTILAPVVSDVYCSGAGVQLDGTYGKASDIETTGSAFGTGGYFTSTANYWTATNVKSHDHLLGYDVNQTPSTGWENDGADNTMIGYQAWGNGGSGLTTFGPRLTCIGCWSYGNGKSKGLLPVLDFKDVNGYRIGYNPAFPNASMMLRGSYAADDGSGDQQYGFSEDSRLSQPSTLLANQLSGALATANILVTGTSIDDYPDLGSNGIKYPLTNPQLTRVGTLTPSGTTSSASNGVMMGLGLTGATITPATTGKIEITIVGDARNGTATDGGAMLLRTGTGTAPSNGDSATGTACTGAINFVSAINGQTVPFSLKCEVTGATLGAPLWTDLAVKTLTGGLATLEIASIVIREVE